MLVVFDGRAQSVPVWLAASGFVLWEGVKLAGAQYRIPYVYKVSESVVVRLWCGCGAMPAGGVLPASAVRWGMNGPCSPVGYSDARAHARRSGGGADADVERARKSTLFTASVGGVRCACPSPSLKPASTHAFSLVLLFVLCVLSLSPSLFSRPGCVHVRLLAPMFAGKVYRKTCKTGVVWLGGNGARGCKGAKRGYFVLVHVANRCCSRRLASRSSEVPPPPASGSRRAGGVAAAEPVSASSSPRLPLHRAVSESGGGRVGGRSGRRTLGRVDGGVDASSTEAEEGSKTTAARQHGGGLADGLEDDDDDSVASAPSAPPGDGGRAAASAAGPALLTPASRNSVGSRSFGSLQDLASSSPDAAGTAAGDDVTGDGGSGGGSGVEGNRPRASSRHSQQTRGRAAVVGLRRRGMSTTDAAVFDTHGISSTAGGFGNRASVGGGGGGRVRSWTGGEEAVLNSVIDNRNGGSGGRVERAAGGGDRRGRAGLQRISPLWDTEKDGSLSQMPVPFDRVGRRWSRTFNVDAAETGGPLETSGATLGVSVSALTGQFHRTRVVTLYPRLIVRNFLGFPLEVSFPPMIWSAAVAAQAAAVAQLRALLLRGGIRARRRSLSGRPTVFFRFLQRYRRFYVAPNSCQQN